MQIKFPYWKNHCTTPPVLSQHEEFEIEYDYMLLEKAKQQVKTLGRQDLHFSGINTPKILFHGFSNPHIALKMLRNGLLNPTNELKWFTNTTQRAACSYGMRIEKEFYEEIKKMGLHNFEIEGHPDWYKANQLKEDLKYVLVVFPHEDTLLGKWLVDEGAPTAYANSSEYITDLDINLSDVVFVRLDKLRPYIQLIDSGKVTRKEELMGLLNVNEEDQLQIRDSLRSELERCHT